MIYREFSFLSQTRTFELINYLEKTINLKTYYFLESYTYQTVIFTGFSYQSPNQYYPYSNYKLCEFIFNVFQMFIVHNLNLDVGDISCNNLEIILYIQ